MLMDLRLPNALFRCPRVSEAFWHIRSFCVVANLLGESNVHVINYLTVVL